MAGLWIMFFGAVGLAVTAGMAVLVFVVFKVIQTGGRIGPLVGRRQVYFGRKYLMTRGEAAFYRVLMEAVGREFVVMTKVRVADIVEVRARGKEWARSFNPVCRKHVDFVLLEPTDFSVRLVIELDDRSHEWEGRRERDEVKDRVLGEAGVVLLRLAAARAYDCEKLAGYVRGAVKNG